MSDQVPVHVEEYYPQFDSWYEADAYPSAEGLTVFVRDISARKLAEATLRERMRISAFSAEVGIRLTESSDVRTMLQRCVEAMVAHLGAAFARIWTLKPTRMSWNSRQARACTRTSTVPTAAFRWVP